MTSSNNTLWMGNIEKWMSHSFLINLFRSINIYPKRITIKNYPSKRSCAFLEFYNQDMARFVLTEYNDKKINGIKLKFNRVHPLKQKFNCINVTKFTVRKKKLNLFL